MKRLVAMLVVVLFCATLPVPARASGAPSKKKPRTVARRTSRRSVRRTKAPTARESADARKIHVLQLQIRKMRQQQEQVKQQQQQLQQQQLQVQQEQQQVQQQLEELKREQEALRHPAPAPVAAPTPAPKVVATKPSPFEFHGDIDLRYDHTTQSSPQDLLLPPDELNGFLTRTRLSAAYDISGPINADLLGKHLKDTAGAELRVTLGENPSPPTTFVRFGDAFRPKSIGFDRFYVMGQPLYDHGLKARIDAETDKDRKEKLQEQFDNKRRLVTLVAGKMPNPFWRGDRTTWRTQTIFDDDVQLEGVALKDGINLLGPKYRLENTFGYFVLDTVLPQRFSGLTGDISLIGDQIKLTTPRINVAFANYGFQNLNAGVHSPSFVPGTSANPITPSSAFLFSPGLQATNNQRNFGPGSNGFRSDSFNIQDFTAQGYLPLGFKELKFLGEPEIWALGELTHNTSVPSQNDASAVTVGIHGRGNGGILHPWFLESTYRDVDADATLATLTDNDLGAGTAYKGWDFVAGYKLTKNLLFYFKYTDFDGFPQKTNHVVRRYFDLDYQW